VKAVQTLHARYKLPAPLANGLDDYPGWGHLGRSHAGLCIGGRVDLVVARHDAARASACTDQRHRLEIRQWWRPAHLHARPWR
jgi:hypothetical protein